MFIKTQRQSDRQIDRQTDRLAGWLTGLIGDGNVGDTEKEK